LSLDLKNVSIGIDVGGSHISVAAVNQDTMQIISGSQSRKEYDHRSEAEIILKVWAEAINHTLLTLSNDMTVSGIGFAMPGPFDYKDGVSRMKQKLTSIYGMNIPSELDLILKKDRNLEMRFLNDATCFAIGESCMGRGAGKSKVVVLTLGTGFGSAFLEQNIPIVKREDVPPEGCLWHLPFGENIADDYFSTKWFSKYYQDHFGKSVEGVRQIVDNSDEKTIEQIFNAFSNNLSTFVGPHLEKFKAEILIIGGNISKAFPHFGSKIKTLIEGQGIDIEISPSELFEDAAILGAAKLLDDKYWTQICKNIPNY